MTRQHHHRRLDLYLHCLPSLLISPCPKATASNLDSSQQMLGPAAPAVATAGTESHSPTNSTLHTSTAARAFIRERTTSELLLLQSVITQELKSRGVSSRDQELSHRPAPDTHHKRRSSRSSESSPLSAGQEPKPQSRKRSLSHEEDEAH
jgi:hypothetical protein